MADSDAAVRHAESPPAGRAGAWLLAAAVVLAAVNLRPAVASVGPVLADLRADLALGATAASTLTAMPVVCFGLGALVAPRLARRFGTEVVMVCVLALLTAGLVVRVTPVVPALFAGTLLATAAIAMGNVLMPALVKREYTARPGLMMGVFVFTLVSGAAVSASATVPLAQLTGRGWQGGLGVWALPAGTAFVVWALLLVQRRRRDAPDDRTDQVPSSLARDPVAWQVTGFMGFQSLIFYALLAWMPTIYRHHGIDPQIAGHLLSVMVAMGAPAALVLPSLLTRTAQQRAWAVGVSAVTAVGLLGLLLAPDAAPLLWAVIIGMGCGGALPLALTLVVLRTPDSQRAAQLSAMSQSVGYLLAAGGPFAIGVLAEATGGWQVPLGLLLALLVPQALVGVAAGRRVLVGAR